MGEALEVGLCPSSQSGNNSPLVPHKTVGGSSREYLLGVFTMARRS